MKPLNWSYLELVISIGVDFLTDRTLSMRSGDIRPYLESIVSRADGVQIGRKLYRSKALTLSFRTDLESASEDSTSERYGRIELVSQSENRKVKLGKFFQIWSGFSKSLQKLEEFSDFDFRFSD